MPSRTDRLARSDIKLASLATVRIEEAFRLGVLRDGIQLTTASIRLPLLGQVIPRIEIEISGPQYLKKVTVRVSQRSPFMLDGRRLLASINGDIREVCCTQYVDQGRAPTGMYNFGLLRENGLRSFVFDYHTYCAYSCDFCFKESEWEVLAVQQTAPASYKANFDECLAYVESHAEDFHAKYDIVWLCTGSITSEKLELQRHCRIARALRSAGYAEGIYVSQVIPPGIRHDQQNGCPTCGSCATRECRDSTAASRSSAPTTAAATSTATRAPSPSTTTSPPSPTPSRYSGTSTSGAACSPGSSRQGTPCAASKPSRASASPRPPQCSPPSS